MLSSAITYRNKKILVAPLDWGLGHVTRCIPLIRQLQLQGNSITVACDEAQEKFLRSEIDAVNYARTPGYRVRYSKAFPLWIMIALQYPRLYAAVKKENRWLKNYLLENKVDVVISDNRYGLYTSDTETIFITHQLFIQSPVFSGWINRHNHNFIKKFDYCWVPDFEPSGSSLSGALSHDGILPGNITYIGPLSRFAGSVAEHTEKYELLVLLSGPEPQRSLLEEKIVGIFGNCGFGVTMVRGAHTKRSFPENFTVIDMAHSAKLHDLLSNARHIICRPGYSTLMDLHALEKRAFLVPTPGQTEQEYLANYWHNTFGFETAAQDRLSRDLLLKFIAGDVSRPVFA